MKRFWFLLIPLVFLSCSKDDENELADAGQLKMELDGREWKAPIISVSSTNGTVQIQAFRNSDSSSVEVRFEDQNFGSYDLRENNEVRFSYSLQNDYWNQVISGKLNILTNESNAYSGSFRAELSSASQSRRVSIKNGSFNWQSP